MTEILAVCRNTAAPCGFETVVRSEQHRQTVEATHMSRWHVDAPPATDDLCDAMWLGHASERDVVVYAIETAAAKNGGQVDLNWVRALIPKTVTPQLVGAVVNVLIRQGRLERIGWTTNEDRHGRNQGKPLALYRLVEHVAGRSA